MKRTLAIIVLCTAAYGTTVAGDNETRRTFITVNVKQIEKDLVHAFQSDIPGLQASAAVTLLQVRQRIPTYDWSASIIPLMHVVNGENHDADARIAAALALHELRSSRGDWAISRNARFASDPRVRRYCAMLAKSRQMEPMTNFLASFV